MRNTEEYTKKKWCTNTNIS